jgi:hypothetical protein
MLKYSTTEMAVPQCVQVTNRYLCLAVATGYSTNTKLVDWQLGHFGVIMKMMKL